MIDIVTSGIPEKREAHVRSAVECYIKLLMPKLENMYIRIKFKKNLRTKTCNSANMHVLDEKVKHRRFSIHIDSTMGFGDILRSLAHECVHIYQYATGRLRNSKDHMMSYWYDKLIDTRKVSYWDLPWEIDAEGREKGLFVRWLVVAGVEGKYKWATWS
jgi:hypothetical protein